MKKINKKSLKQQGGQSVNPQEQQMAQQQQQQQGQQQQQDPTAELAASFSEMVESGYEPKQAIMEFIKAEVPEELIYQTLLKVGYSEDDVQALFTQVSEEVQQASNEQRSMMQPQQQMPQAQYGKEHQYNIKHDEGIVNNYGARVRKFLSQIDPSAGYNRGDVLSKGLRLAETLSDTFKPKYSFSQGMNPFSKEDRDGDGFADGWFMDSKEKNLLKKNLRQRDKNIRKLQGRSIKIHENDPNDYRFNSMGDFITTQQYDDDVKKYSTAQFVSPTNSYKGYAYDSDPTPYMTPQQKKDYWQHKQEFGTVGDFWKDPVTGKSKKPKKQQKSKWHYMDFMKGYKYGGDLDRYQFQGETLPPSPLEPVTFEDWYKSKGAGALMNVPQNELNALYKKETGYDAGSPAVDPGGTKPWKSPEFMPPKITDPNKSKRTWNQIGNVVGKVGEIGYQAADFVNEAAKAWQDLSKPTDTADTLYNITQNPAGGQGFWDVNSGYLQQDEKTLEGYGWAQRGGGLPSYQLKGSVNQNTFDPDVYGQRILGNTPIDYRDPNLGAMLSAMQAQNRGISRGVTGISNTPKKLPKSNLNESFIPASESTRIEKDIQLSPQQEADYKWWNEVYPNLSPERQAQHDAIRDERRGSIATLFDRIGKVPGMLWNQQTGQSQDPTTIAPTVLPTDPRFYDQAFQGMNMATTIPAYINSYADYRSGKRETPMPWKGIFPSGIQGLLGKEDGEQLNIINSLRNDPDFCKKYPLRCAAEEMGLGFWGLPGKLGKKLTGKLAKGAAKDVSKDLLDPKNADELAFIKRELEEMRDKYSEKELTEIWDAGANDDLQGITDIYNKNNQRWINTLKKESDEYVNLIENDDNIQFLISLKNTRQKNWGAKYTKRQRQADDNMIYERKRQLLIKEGHDPNITIEDVKRIEDKKMSGYYDLGKTQDDVVWDIQKDRYVADHTGLAWNTDKNFISTGDEALSEAKDKFKNYFRDKNLSEQKELAAGAGDYNHQRKVYDAIIDDVRDEFPNLDLKNQLEKASKRYEKHSRSQLDASKNWFNSKPNYSSVDEEVLDYITNFKQQGGMIRKTQNGNIRQWLNQNYPNLDARNTRFIRQLGGGNNVGQERDEPIYPYSGPEEEAAYMQMPYDYIQYVRGMVNDNLTNQSKQIERGRGTPMMMENGEAVLHPMNQEDYLYGDPKRGEFIAAYGPEGKRDEFYNVMSPEQMKGFRGQKGTARDKYNWILQNYPQLKNNFRLAEYKQQRGGDLYKAQTGVPMDDATAKYLSNKYGIHKDSRGVYPDWEKLPQNIQSHFLDYNRNVVSEGGVPFTTGTAPLTAQLAALQGNYAQYMEQNPNIPVQTIHKQESITPPAMRMSKQEPNYDMLRRLYETNMQKKDISSPMQGPEYTGYIGPQGEDRKYGGSNLDRYQKRGEYRTRNIPPISLMYENMYKTQSDAPYNWPQYIEDAYPQEGYRGSNGIDPRYIEFFPGTEAFKPKRGDVNVDQWGDPLFDNWEKDDVNRRMYDSFWNNDLRKKDPRLTPFDPLEPMEGQEKKWEQLKEMVRFNEDRHGPKKRRFRKQQGGNINPSFYEDYMPVYQHGGQPTNIAEVDDRMIQKLIAAGADIEYL